MAERPKGYLSKGKTKSPDAARKAKAREIFTPKGLGKEILNAALSGAPIGRGARAAGAAVKVVSRAEKKAISLANARLRANIDKMEKSGLYKKVGTSAPKATPVSKPTKPKPSTKEVVGRTMRKRAEPKLRPKDVLLETPATKLESLKKKQYLNQLMSRPVARNRDVPKPSTQSLTAREKLYEKLGEKAKVTVTKGKPLTKQDRAKARKAKFDKVLSPRPKPKPNRTPLKPIDKSRGSNAPVKPKLDDFQQTLENAKNNPRNWDIADQRPKATIDKGRGNTQQPPSVTKNSRPGRQEKRSVRVEARNVRRAEKRDRRTDAIASKQTPRIVTYKGNSRLVNRKPTTNHPGNAASDAGNMEERLKAVDNIINKKAKLKELYKGNNAISAKTKDSVDKTLETARILRNRLKAADRASKPTPRVRKRLSSTRPTTPKKKQGLNAIYRTGNGKS